MEGNNEWLITPKAKVLEIEKQEVVGRICWGGGLGGVNGCLPETVH